MDDRNDRSVSRRSLLKVGGMAVVGVWSAKALPAAGEQAKSSGPIDKPLFLAPSDATDAAIHSRVENLFWCDTMMEHAAFFAMLMPGPALARERAEAESFQRSFQSQYDRAKAATLDRANHSAFDRSTVE